MGTRKQSLQIPMDNTQSLYTYKPPNTSPSSVCTQNATGPCMFRAASVSWGGTITEPNQEASTKPTPERERFSVPHASRDPKILQDVNLENEEHALRPHRVPTDSGLWLR